jgi:hypothetical protein
VNKPVVVDLSPNQVSKLKRLAKILVAAADAMVLLKEDQDQEEEQKQKQKQKHDYDEEEEEEEEEDKKDEEEEEEEKEEDPLNECGGRGGGGGGGGGGGSFSSPSMAAALDSLCTHRFSQLVAPKHRLDIIEKVTVTHFVGKHLSRRSLLIMMATGRDGGGGGGCWSWWLGVGDEDDASLTDKWAVETCVETCRSLVQCGCCFAVYCRCCCHVFMGKDLNPDEAYCVFTHI